MNLPQIMKSLDLRLLTQSQHLEQVFPTSGYASDLLSCVLAGAGHGSLWVTLQAHLNIVAVAALLELKAVIITEGALPDEATLAKANTEGVILLSTDKKTFEVVGQLWDLGLRSAA